MAIKVKLEKDGFIKDGFVGYSYTSAIFTKLMYGDIKFMEKYNKALERVNSEAVEYVRGMQVLKIFY